MYIYAVLFEGKTYNINIFVYFLNLQSSEVLKRTHKHLSIISVFLEEVRKTEQLEYGMHSYYNHVRQVEQDGIRWLLCEMHTALLTHHGTDHESYGITRDHMSSPLRNIFDTGNRRSRDFVILKDVHNHLGYISEEARLVRNKLLSPASMSQ